MRRIMSYEQLHLRRKTEHDCICLRVSRSTRNGRNSRLTAARVESLHLPPKLSSEVNLTVDDIAADALTHFKRTNNTSRTGNLN